jgi:ABC-type multidrug transport system, ATPase component
VPTRSGRPQRRGQVHPSERTDRAGPADRGSVLYDGRDLYRDYAELRQRIGLVPQDDILHTQLIVRRPLVYAAELRFPQDTAPAEREARVGEVIRELGLQERAEQPIRRLSGGQRSG